MTALVTHHARTRVWERLGLTGFVVETLAAWTLEQGLSRADVGGKLGRYLDHMAIRGRGNDLRLMGAWIWIFADLRLLTVVRLPRRYHALGIKYWRERHG